ncbi:hypothetical protein GQ55_8G202300 [Panicum hallii var. hallii]|uniref:Uncharacterized protein n=1 Tax=Panicum hallii var. hallii TaxID=1504633 RepID=A0A2T7CPE2_9POAL|nr:hypothetical protein GQ55_8G202300 [Panicum hallii var. hallii]
MPAVTRWFKLVLIVACIQLYITRKKKIRKAASNCSTDDYCVYLCSVRVQSVLHCYL